MRKITLPVNRLSEGSRQKISDFEALAASKRKSLSDDPILSLYCSASFSLCILMLPHDNLLLYKCYLIEQLQTAHRKSEDPGDQLFHGISRDPAPRLLMVRLQQRPFLENVISQADYEYLKKCLIRDGKTNYYFAVRIMAATGCGSANLFRSVMERYPAWSARPLFKRQQDPAYLLPAQCTGDLSDVAAKRKQVQRQLCF